MGTTFPHAYQGATQGDLPFIKVSDFPRADRLGVLDGANNWVDRRTARQLGARIVPRGSILYARVGAALLLNQRCIAGRNCIVDDNVRAFEPHYGDPRFWRYLMLLLDMAKITNPGPVPSVSERQVAALPVPLPSAEEQRRIADFLDAETARIDRLTSMRDRQSKLLDDRRRSQLSELVASLTQRFGSIRLRHMSMRIEQGWSPQCEDRLAEYGEWGVVKAGCVNSGRFDPIQHKALPADVEPRREYVLKRGDLLMSRASGSIDLIGSVGVVGEISDNLLLCDKVYRIRLDWTRAQADFVAHVLRGHQAREHIKIGISGAEGMANNLPTSVVKDLLLPNVPVSKQASISDSLHLSAESVARARESLHRSVQTLTERRKALITAAVTGQFDVSTASGRN